MGWMSVVSLARTAGVTRLEPKRRSWMVRTSDVLADMSMMSTRPWRTTWRIWSRYSASERALPVTGSLPVAAKPAAMSASLASARMKSLALLGLAQMLAIFWSSVLVNLFLRKQLGDRERADHAEDDAE